MAEGNELGGAWTKPGEIDFEKENLVISERIVRHILDKITKGELSPGDTLPSEKQLIEYYNVSRGCVREALRTLQIMNVITIQQGKGASVTSLDISLLVQHLEFAFAADAEAIFYVFDVRKALEPPIAALAAQRVTDEEIVEFRALLKRAHDYDKEFHQKMARAAKNPILDRVVSGVWRLSQISRSRTSVIPGVRERAHIQHSAMVDALEKRDARQCQALMREHLEFLEASYQQEVEGAKTQEP